MYRLCYNRLDIDVGIVQPEIFSKPAVEIAATCDVRVKYVNTPSVVGSCYRSEQPGKVVVYTILSCVLEQRSPERVRFSNYVTDEVSELKAKLAQLELSNERLKQAAPPLGPSDRTRQATPGTFDRS